MGESDHPRASAGSESTASRLLRLGGKGREALRGRSSCSRSLSRGELTERSQTARERMSGKRGVSWETTGAGHRLLSPWPLASGRYGIS